MINVEQYWLKPPPVRSSGCAKWLKKIEAGWKPNRRIGSMGYYEAAEFYGVFIWEYINEIRPALEVADASRV